MARQAAFLFLTVVGQGGQFYSCPFRFCGTAFILRRYKTYFIDVIAHFGFQK